MPEVVGEDTVSGFWFLLYPMRVIHVWSNWDQDPEELARHTLAKSSWPQEWAEVPVWCPDKAFRDSRELGEQNPTPFVKDIIEVGMELAGEDDAVILTNTDVGFIPETHSRLLRLLGMGAVFGYRHDHHYLTRHITYGENIRGYFKQGVDMVAFTKRFWMEHRDKFPDAVMGRPFWDHHFREVIREHGGAELWGCMWHCWHHSWWQRNMRSPGFVHNEQLYLRYKQERGLDKPGQRFN